MTTPDDAAQLGAEAPAWDPGCRESEPPDSPSSHVISGGLQRGAEPAASVLGPQGLLGCCLRNAGTPRPAPRKWPAAPTSPPGSGQQPSAEWGAAFQILRVFLLMVTPAPAPPPPASFIQRGP